jgi:hypothetical protein
MALTKELKTYINQIYDNKIEERKHVLTEENNVKTKQIDEQLKSSIDSFKLQAKLLIEKIKELGANPSNVLTNTQPYNLYHCVQSSYSNDEIIKKLNNERDRILLELSVGKGIAEIRDILNKYNISL